MTARRYENDKKAAANLATSLKTLPDQFIVCRDVRHAWAVLTDYHVTPSQHEGGRKVMLILRVLVCMRCDTQRHEFYAMGRGYDGLEKTHQHYVYPEAYQIPGVPRGVKPSNIIQQESYRRAMEKVAHALPGEREHSER